MKRLFILITTITLLLSLYAEDAVWSQPPYATGDRISITIPAKKIVENPTATFQTESESITIAAIKSTENGLVITLVPWDTGEIKIPEITVAAGAKNITVPAKKVAINAVTTEQETELKDVKENAIALMDDYLPIWIGLGVLGALLLAALIYYLLKKRKKAADAIEITISPYELGMRYYTHAETALHNEKIGSAVDNITIGVRHYLEARTKILFLEMTTREVIKAYRKNELSRDIEEPLHTMLKTGDKYKFAEENLSQTEVNSMLQTFSTVLKDTETVFAKQEAAEKAKKEVKDAVS